MDQSKPDPSKILQIGMGFFASKVLLSAVELGVFETVAGGPICLSQLRDRLGLHERGAADFFDSLVALGLLSREGDGTSARYGNTADTAAFLVPASSGYIGGILKMANNRLYHFWGNLTEALRTGLPQSEIKQSNGHDAFAALYDDPRRLAEFLDAMAGVQRGNFAVLAETFEFDRFTKICDVGGASGALSIALAKRHPSLQCISYDLPAVTELARQKILDAGLSDRITAVSGNFLADGLPHAEVITMGNILHDWGTSTKTLLIENAYGALPVGGALIAIENVIDDARRANSGGLLMSLNMLIETPDGYDYTFAQFDDWCCSAGFRSTQSFPLTGAASAAIAWK
jgi:hypothetical protein